MVLCQRIDHNTGALIQDLAVAQNETISRCVVCVCVYKILECLYHAKWSKLDGLGVLVISPTRELAYQTFEVLKKIGKYHDFSAGLVIGGKVSIA